jgi:SAM-dependent methyltransferase
MKQMKPISLPLVMGLLVSFGCRTIPGQDVRYDPTPTPVVRAMLKLADVGPQDVVYDLGSGDGRIPITAAKEFGARGVGIEIDPTLVRQAQAKAREAGVADKVEFRLGDMYVADVRPATVVTLFLHPKPNLKLRPKLRSELQPGSRVVSYTWDMADWAPDETHRVNAQRIFLWRIPYHAALIIGPNCRFRSERCRREAIRVRNRGRSPRIPDARN